VIHGVGMCLSKAFGKYTKKLPAAIRFIFTFIYINLTWVFFRARTVTEAISVIKALFSLSFNTLDKNTNFVVSVMPAEFELFQWLLSLNHPELTKLSGLIVTILIVLTASLISVLAKNPQERIKAFRPNRRLLAGTVILLVWSVISLSNISTFIYTNF
jgi:alginate O-acetyltransferase complex protein AlgI